MTAARTVVVMAKAPIAGRVKTRLCPPLDPASAARLAEAALVDTLGVVERIQGARRVVALDGEPGAWLRPTFEVVAQRGHGLDERIAHALTSCAGPTVVIGMDTPQIRVDQLECAFERLDHETDAVLGPAHDGGYWILGLASPTPRAVRGVPMSTASTAAAQFAQLRSLGLSTAVVAPLRDVDRYSDALAVAAAAPTSRFARTLTELEGHRSGAWR